MEVRSEAIMTNLYERTVEMVQSAKIGLQFLTKDYGVKDTQTLRSEISSIVTVEVARKLQDSDKGIVKDAIIEAV